MSALQMVSVPVNLRELRRLSSLHGLARDEGRTLHHLLGETFGKGGIQPFRLMPGRNGVDTASLYGYSAQQAETLAQKSGETAPPEASLVFDMAHLAMKAMPANWTEGRRLAFDIRVRPVRRLMQPLVGGSPPEHGIDVDHANGRFLGKGAEVDAFIVERLRGQPDGLTGARAEPLREDVYRSWLAERLQDVADVDTASTRLVKFERSRALRGARFVEGPDATMHGELTVKDGAAFARSLARGIGRHVAYGYGMLLLRPARG